MILVDLQKDFDDLDHGVLERSNNLKQQRIFVDNSIMNKVEKLWLQQA